MKVIDLVTRIEHQGCLYEVKFIKNGKNIYTVAVKSLAGGTHLYYDENATYISPDFDDVAAAFCMALDIPITGIEGEEG